MYVFLVNGRCIHLSDAVRYERQAIAKDGEELVCFAKRNVELMRFRIGTVAGWCFDNIEITTFGTDDRVEPMN